MSYSITYGNFVAEPIIYLQSCDICQQSSFLLRLRYIKVPPIALEELIRITKPGGLLLVSTRKSYYDTSDFQATCDRLQKEGKCSLIDSVMDGPYIAEEGAHYWAFQVS